MAIPPGAKSADAATGPSPSARIGRPDTIARRNSFCCLCSLHPTSPRHGGAEDGRKGDNVSVAAEARWE